MRDLFNFGGTVLIALLFAASLFGDLTAPQGAKFTQASLVVAKPSLTDQVAARGARRRHAARRRPGADRDLAR